MSNLPLYVNLENHLESSKAFAGNLNFQDPSGDELSCRDPLHCESL